MVTVVLFFNILVFKNNLKIKTINTNSLIIKTDL